MSARQIFVGALTVFAVMIGAGMAAHISSQKRVEAMQAESNRLINQVEILKHELNLHYGISLSPLVETVSPSARAREYRWAKLSPKQLRIVLAKLRRHYELVNRVFELSSQDGLRLGGGAEDLRKSADAAWRYYLAGKQFSG